MNQPQTNQSGRQLQLNVLNYKAGTCIIVERKIDSDCFFIIKAGKVKIESPTDVLFDTKRKLLEPGDFFGVIGAMTGQPRLETAIAATDVSLIAVKKGMFGLLLAKSAPLALKIIRSFSNNLRIYNNKLMSKSIGSEKESESENAAGLYSNGKYYLQANNRPAAAYIFKRYLELYPDGEFKDKAQKALQTLGSDLVPEKESMERVYKDEEIICSEFEPGSELYIIQQGRLKVTKIVGNQERLLAVLNTGDIVGEMSLLNDQNRTASILSHGPSKILAVSKANFDKIVVSNSQMATKLIVLLSERIWTVYKQLENLTFTDPTARLWDILLTELLKTNTPINKEPHVFNIGIKELSEMIGMDKEVQETAAKKLLAHESISIVDGSIACDEKETIEKEVSFAYRTQLREQKIQEAKIARQRR